MFTRYLLIIFVSTILNYGSSEIVSASDTPSAPDLEELDQIYAIHATYKIPEDGVMIPGKVSNGKKTGNAFADSLKKGEPLPGVAGWRPTLHFSLAGLCPDSNENTLSDRQHAIIVQVKDLKDRLIGLQPFDSFILGSFEIPANAHLIVPEEEVAQMQETAWVKERGIRIIPRNDRPLRIQILKFLSDVKSWVFMGEEGKKEFTALKDGKSLTVGKVFFDSLLDAKPHIHYAPHTQHWMGFIDGNARFLLLPKLGSKVAFTIPGGTQLKDLVILMKQLYEKKLKENSPELGALFEEAYLDLNRRVTGTEKGNNLKSLYFGNEQEEMVNYALTWLAKGNYLLYGKAHAIGFKLNNHKYQKTVKEINEYLEEIGMLE